ncbi:TPA: O-antigen translocase [Photobacterium damselae]
MKKFFSVTALTALLTLFRMCTSFIVAKIVAIYTGPSGIAMLGQIQGVVGVLNGIINSPVSSGVVRYTSENIDSGYNHCAPWWKASIIWIITISIIIIPLGIIFNKYISEALFHDNTYGWLISLICISLPFTAINTFLLSIVNGLQKYKSYIILGALSTLITTILMVTLVSFFSIDGALLAASINTGVSGLIMICVAYHYPWFKLVYFIGRVDKDKILKIGSYVLMATTSALTVPLSIVIVRNILITQVGWDHSGQWQAVWRISEVYLSIITISLGTYFLPRLSKLSTAIEIKKEVNKMALVIMPIVIILAISVYFLRDIIITILFTNEFRNARDLFLIQLCGDVVKILSWLYAYPMLSRGAVKWYVSSEILFAITFISSTFLFVSEFGVNGANMSYLFSYIIYFMFVCFNFNKVISK